MNKTDAIFQAKLPLHSLRVVVFMCANLYPTARNLVEELDIFQIRSPILAISYGGQERSTKNTQYAPMLNAPKEYQCQDRPGPFMKQQTRATPVNEVVHNYLTLQDVDGVVMNTRYIAFGDVNGDGLIDLVIGNNGEDNQLLINSGDGTFSDTAANLLGVSMRTMSIMFGDVNGDGFIDLVIGNWGQENQMIHYALYQKGGVLFHTKSWCFKCPSFMGQELSSLFCEECMPNFTSGRGELCCDVLLSCTLGERKFGQDVCNGTFYTNNFFQCC